MPRAGVKTHEQEYWEKWRTVKSCPKCGGERHPKDKRGMWMVPIRCKHEFHTWFCSNDYSSDYGCHGHEPGALRCMDCG